MNFQYQVRDPLGKTYQGTVEAPDADEARQLLAGDGLQVLQLEESDDDLLLIPRRVSRSDIIYVTSQLAVMVDTGINLATALAGICDQETNPTLRRMLADLKSRVEGGEDFSRALERYPKYFDRRYVALIKASERTGSLGEMLDRLASYLRSEMDMRSKVRAALAYPTVMLCLACGVTVFLLTFVLPKFAPLFQRKGVKLPKTTIFMMAVSDALLHHWVLWLAALVALIAAWFFGRRSTTGRQVLDWVRLHVPIIGPLVRKVTLSRSIRTLGTMIRSGVPVLDAIQLSSDVAVNVFYQRSWQSVLEQVTQGNRISDALAHDHLFPKTLVQMIGAGEETARLDEVLQKVSSYYDREVETAIKTTTSLLEPLLIAVMGVVVGGIALSLLLPIFTLSRAAGH